MNRLSFVAVCALALVSGAEAQSPAGTESPRMALTPLELARGYMLFSGPGATNMWRTHGTREFPKQGWKIDAGEITQTGPGGGDLETGRPYADFDFQCQFKLDAKANSGILWRVAQDAKTTWYSGPEYQLIDDVGYPSKLNAGQKTGSLYDLYPAAEGKPDAPAGQWNRARIRLCRGVLQHYLNDTKVVEARIFDESGKPTPEWRDKIAASKFKENADFAAAPLGAIVFQDHGGGVAFRDVIIRDLNAPLGGQYALFNGLGLQGWKAIVPDAEKHSIKPEDVWSVKDGVLICKGTPGGYIRTEKKFTNFILKLEWRFTPDKPGNSGVLLRMVGEDKVWPKSVEAQLQSGQAGDFWNIDSFPMRTDPERTKGRNTKRTHTAERPLGEWNDYEIIVNHGEVILYVNGEELNRATAVEEVAGHICLQSEGAEIHFRNINLVVLE